MVKKTDTELKPKKLHVILRNKPCRDVSLYVYASELKQIKVYGNEAVIDIPPTFRGTALVRGVAICDTGLGKAYFMTPINVVHYTKYERGDYEYLETWYLTNNYKVVCRSEFCDKIMINGIPLDELEIVGWGNVLLYNGSGIPVKIKISIPSYGMTVYEGYLPPDGEATINIPQPYVGLHSERDDPLVFEIQKTTPEELKKALMEKVVSQQVSSQQEK